MTMFLAAYHNPYANTSFFEFINCFLNRLLTGFPKLIYLDEMQVIVLALVAISASFVGTLLVLKKSAMIANTLSHTILLGIAIAFLTQQSFSPTLSISRALLASVFSGLCTCFLIEFLTKKSNLGSDASNAIVFSLLFSVAIVIISLFCQNSHIGVEAVMGNVDALHYDDLFLTLAMTAINLFVVIFFFRGFKIAIFDPQFAQANGISVHFFHYLLMILVALTSVSAFRSVGVVLVIAYLVGLPLIARQFTKKLHTMMLVSAVIGLGVALVSVALSRHLLSVHQLALSTGGLSVLILSFILILIFAVKTCKRLKSSLSLAPPAP